MYAILPIHPMAAASDLGRHAGNNAVMALRQVEIYIRAIYLHYTSFPPDFPSGGKLL